MDASRNTSNMIYYTTPYYRLSNDDGDLAAFGKEESHSISNQRSLIEEFVKDKPEIVLCQERIDDGFSGVNFERPAFQKMLTDVKAGKINCIIVKDLSRFGRNYIEVGRFLQKIFPYLGVRFIAVTDHYDSLSANSAESHIMLPFKNLLNDSYSRDISTKVRSQFEIKRKKGDFIGAFAVYGYQKDGENKNHLVVDGYAALVVQDIFKWKLEGKSNEKIADKLNIIGVLSPAEYKKSLGMKYRTGFHRETKALWSPLAVRRILTNQTYLGHIVQGKKTTPNHKVKKRIEKEPEEWIVVRNKHIPIISEGDFTAVQKALQLDTRIAPKNQELYIFSGFVACGDCGERLVRKLISSGKDAYGKMKKYPYLMCSSYKQDSHCCSSHLVREDLLEQVVLATLKAHINNLPNLKQVLKVVNQKPSFQTEANKLEIPLITVKKEVIKYKKLQEGLSEDLETGIINKKEYFEMKQLYIEQRKDCEEQILRLKEAQEQENISNMQKKNGVDFFLANQNIDGLNRTIILKWIDKIIIYNKERMSVQFNFQDIYALFIREGVDI